MVSINTNLTSLITQRSLNQSTNKLNQAIERMSTGYKINHAGDNAANYSIATDMSTKISAYQVAEENTSMGLDMVSTANGALDEIQDRLSRLRALAEQASNGTYGKDSIDAIKAEAKALSDEIVRVYNNTEYNGTKLFGEYKNCGFMNEIEIVTPDVVVTDPAQLADAISSNSIIGIDNADVLHELAHLVNSGTSCSGKTIILTNDIDLSDYQEGNGWTPIGKSSTYSFKGTFDGQGHFITNMQITKDPSYAALFGYAVGATVKNIAVVDCNINCGGDYVAGLIGYAQNVKAITNCYVSGEIVGKSRTGGIVGADASSNSTLSSCFSTANIDGYMYVGGIAGLQNGSLDINNCGFYGDVKGENYVAGIVGTIWGSGTLSDTICTGTVSCRYTVHGLIGDSDKFSVTNSYSYGTVKKGNTIVTDEYTRDPSESPLCKKQTSLQIGVYSDEASQIKLVTEFDISELAGIACAIKNTKTLDKIDNLISNISAKQTELGSVQNRLESALESISTCYDNLVSSRSTIQDADMGKVSSDYIRQQILQQACATLMSTANQTPSIALQLL